MSKGRWRRLILGNQSWDRLLAHIVALRSAGVLAALILATILLMPANASAESLCTDTWSGPSEGEWSTAGDWSTGKVPSSSDVACVGSGATVKVASGSDVAGVLQGEGGVMISGGSLELTSTLEESTIHSLRLTGGTLTGAGTLKVSGSLAWESGTMSGLVPVPALRARTG